MFDETIDRTRKACDLVPGAWEYLKNRSNKPFMFAYDEPMVVQIGEKCDELGCGHSGASFALCMRQMKYEADKKISVYTNG